MRYLRKYNESSENDSVKQTVKDILLPISDMGYDISVTGDNENLVIRVVSWGDKPLLITDEVKEEFIRMKDYLQSEGYNSIQALYHPTHHLVLKTDGVGIMGNSGREIKEFDSFMKYEPWQKVKIQNLLFVAK
jgi:hypothetical protein